ncbi:hypothetical protein IAT38_002831 [Cryptococcus sp. DSM 104549]
MITLTPLSASAASSSSSEPISYLLELDNARILLDLGQRDYRASAQQANWEYEEKVRELAPTLSLVLLSHSPTNYLSLYPYARARWGLTCPVYATQPTVEMGRIVCLAEAESWRSECKVEAVEGEKANEDGEGESSMVVDLAKKPLHGPFVPTAEEIHEAFDWVKAIRYNQPLHLGGDLSHLLLTPFPSGHSLGGTLFKIRSPTSGTVLYAVGINHASERHLDGMVGAQNGPTGYADGVQRPDLLIVEGGRSLVVNPKRKARETALLDVVTSTLEHNHSVLLPCDASPRLLELLVLLDQHWTFKLSPAPIAKRPRQGPAGNAWPYPLCIVSRTAGDMVAFARSLIEWMGGVVKDSGGEVVVGDQIGKKGAKRARRARAQLGSEFGALDFRHVQFFLNPTDLLQAFPANRPKLVLAIPPTMSHGPSRFLFTTFANTEGNVILLTSRSEDSTLGRDLYDRWEAKQDGEAKWGKGKIGKPGKLEGNLSLEMDSKVPLTGLELEQHLESERLQKERDAAHKAALDRSRRMLEADDLESDSDDESDSGGPAGGVNAQRAENANAYAGDGEDVRTMSFDIFVKGQRMRVGRGAEMARFRMFPFVERKGRKVDQYGEGLDIGQWMRKGREIAEEGETEEVREARKKKEEEEERQKQRPEIPSKYISEKVDLDLKASIFFVDMEGLHDGQSIKTIISDLQPRKLIVVRSSTEATDNLTSFLSSTTGFTKDIFAPALGAEIKIGEHVQSYSLTLGDSIASTLTRKWSKYEGYEVAMVEGKIVLPAGSTIPILELSSLVQPLPVVTEGDDADADEDVKPTAEQLLLEDTKPPIPSPPAPASSTALIAPTDARPPLPTSTFIGDLRLALLKHRLSTLTPPIPAEFAGEGVLVCGEGIQAAQEGKEGGAAGVVAVRKMGEGRIVLEGSIGKVYYAVRKELYGGLARVDGA